MKRLIRCGICLLSYDARKHEACPNCVRVYKVPKQ